MEKRCKDVEENLKIARIQHDCQIEQSKLTYQELKNEIKTLKKEKEKNAHTLELILELLMSDSRW